MVVTQDIDELEVKVVLSQLPTPTDEESTTDITRLCDVTETFSVPPLLKKLKEVGVTENLY